MYLLTAWPNLQAYTISTQNGNKQSSKSPALRLCFSVSNYEMAYKCVASVWTAGVILLPLKYFFESLYDRFVLVVDKVVAGESGHP